MFVRFDRECSGGSDASPGVVPATGPPKRCYVEDGDIYVLVDCVWRILV